MPSEKEDHATQSGEKNGSEAPGSREPPPTFPDNARSRDRHRLQLTGKVALRKLCMHPQPVSGPRFHSTSSADHAHAHLIGGGAAKTDRLSSYS